jgi:hypothetical protein
MVGLRPRSSLLSLSHTHTRTLFLSLSLSHTHTHTLSLSLSLFLSLSLSLPLSHSLTWHGAASVCAAGQPRTWPPVALGATALSRARAVHRTRHGLRPCTQGTRALPLLPSITHTHTYTHTHTHTETHTHTHTHTQRHTHKPYLLLFVGASGSGVPVALVRAGSIVYWIDTDASFLFGRWTMTGVGDGGAPVPGGRPHARRSVCATHTNPHARACVLV